MKAVQLIPSLLLLFLGSLNLILGQDTSDFAGKIIFFTNLCFNLKALEYRL
jgi:hypothetical protein